MPATISKKTVSKVQREARMHPVEAVLHRLGINSNYCPATSTGTGKSEFCVLPNSIDIDPNGNEAEQQAAHLRDLAERFLTAARQLERNTAAA